MHFVKKVFKIGGSLAVGLPKKLIEETEIKEGDLVLFTKGACGINIRNINDIIDNRDKTNKGGQNVING